MPQVSVPLWQEMVAHLISSLVTVVRQVQKKSGFGNSF